MLLLGADVETVFLYIVPCALLLVPTSALVLFKSYTKKGDVAYLASIPLTRPRLFFTTYLVGITIIEAVLLVMVFIGCINTPSDMFQALTIFLSLGLIYFTFASLGCMLSGHLFKQMMNMGVICFGPLGIYLLSKWSTSEFTFGGYSIPLDNDFMMLMCPLVSAAKFLDDWVWPYAFVHLVLVIGCIGLCIYLMKQRPLERTEQNTLFKTIHQWVILPVVYLNIVYLLFNILAVAIFSQSHYFDRKYYMSILLLLVGVSLLVGILMSIWKSKTMKDIFKFKEITYQAVLVLISATLFVIPLWQTENARSKYLENTEEVYINLPVDTNYTWANVSKSDLVEFLDATNKSRHLFLSEQGDASIYIGYDQRYYFNFSEMNESTKKFVEKVYLQFRQTGRYWEYLTTDFILMNNEVIDAKSIKGAIESTYEDTMSDTFISNVTQVDDIYDHFLGEYVGPYWAYTFTSMDYQTWLEFIQNNIKVVLDKAEWHDIEKAVNDACTHPLNYEISSNYLLNIAKYIDVEDVDYPESWVIEKVTKDYINMRVPASAYILEDCSIDGFDLFKDTYYWLTFEIELNKVNGIWIPKFKGVYY